MPRQRKARKQEEVEVRPVRHWLIAEDKQGRTGHLIPADGAFRDNLWFWAVVDTDVLAPVQHVGKRGPTVAAVMQNGSLAVCSKSSATVVCALWNMRHHTGFEVAETAWERWVPCCYPQNPFYYTNTWRQRPVRELCYILQVVENGKPGPIKIGCSQEPKIRRGSIQPWCPYPIRLLAVKLGNRAREVELHERFAEHRLHGEWFRHSEEIVRLAHEEFEPVDVVNAGDQEEA